MKKFEFYFFCVIIISFFFFTSCEHKSGRGYITKRNYYNKTIKRHVSPTFNSNKVTVKMIKKNGVYYIPCKVNGYDMEFIFDTGASDISISLSEANYLYRQGKLTNGDFLGSQSYRIANGSLEEAKVVNLKTVEIGNRTLYNVQASIINNLQAPLLLGQSALNKFGKISIDYKKSEITFE